MFVRNVVSSVWMPDAGIAARCTTASAPARLGRSSDWGGSMSSRRLVLVLLATVAAGAVAAGIAVAGKGNGNDKTFEYAIGLWGDMPYSAVQAQTGVPNLLADMNNSDIQ